MSAASLKIFSRHIVLAMFCLSLASFSTIKLFAADAADSRPKLVINSASYGDLDGDKKFDVTAKVAALVKDNSLNVDATNANFGDPVDGVPKQLKVAYTFDGIYRTKTVNEGENLDISTRLIVTRAVYGDLAGGATADVTEQVAGLVKKNALSVQATNDNFGDPAGGIVKHLRVDYTLDGVAMSKTVDENGVIQVAASAK